MKSLYYTEQYFVYQRTIIIKHRGDISPSSALIKQPLSAANGHKVLLSDTPPRPPPTLTHTHTHKVVAFIPCFGLILHFLFQLLLLFSKVYINHKHHCSSSSSTFCLYVFVSLFWIFFFLITEIVFSFPCYLCQMSNNLRNSGVFDESVMNDSLCIHVCCLSYNAMLAYMKCLMSLPL